ncbi:MAG: aldehyde dehydrogenase family protein [Thermodesulfobacteriota bacterium]
MQTETHKIMIGGEWRETSKKERVLNPFNGKVVAEVYHSTEKEFDEVIDKAEQAFAVTRNLPVYKRVKILERVIEGLKERQDELAETITLEAGKPILSSRTEVLRAINTFTIAMEEAKRIPGEVIPLDLMEGSEGRVGIVRRFPVGPILGISPFNFPLNLVAHKVAPAIAAGNPIIIKPASKTPLTALILGDIVDKAGGPDGAISVIPCPGSIAGDYIGDKRIEMLTFTGSPEVGWALKGRAGRKKVTLELGGNAGAIVHSDSDIDLAAKRCVVGAFSYSGQVCISVQRIFVQQEVYGPFLKRLIETTKALRIGDPMDEKTDIGPMIDKGAVDRIEEWVEEAVKGGAKVTIGGKRKGTVFDPTILTDTRPDMKVNCKEVFAPVVTVEPYKDFEEAVQGVNDSDYGLQAGVFTNDLNRIFYAFNEIQAGGVIVNDVPTYRTDQMPYGGIKESGFGREGVKYAIEEMTEMKLLALNTN